MERKYAYKLAGIQEERRNKWKHKTSLSGIVTKAFLEMFRIRMRARFLPKPHDLYVICTILLLIPLISFFFDRCEVKKKSQCCLFFILVLFL